MSQPSSRLPMRNIFLFVSGLTASALGGMALLGWFMGWRILASFGAGLIPMAPSTAILFLLYGVAVALRAWTPLSGLAFRFTSVVCSLGLPVATLLFTLSCLDMPWKSELLGFNTSASIGQVPIGYMSPITAGGFLLVGLSLLASHSRTKLPVWRAMLASGGAVMLLGGNFFSCWRICTMRLCSSAARSFHRR